MLFSTTYKVVLCTTPEGLCSCTAPSGAFHCIATALPPQGLCHCTAPEGVVPLHCPLRGCATALPPQGLCHCTAPSGAVPLHCPLRGCANALPHQGLCHSTAPSRAVPLTCNALHCRTESSGSTSKLKCFKTKNVLFKYCKITNIAKRLWKYFPVAEVVNKSRMTIMRSPPSSNWRQFAFGGN